MLASGVLLRLRVTFEPLRIFGWYSYLMNMGPTGGADGATHVERLVDGFAAPLLQRWRKLDVNHSLSVVLFARVSGGGIERHRDVYRVVLENEAASKAEPATLVSALKRELVAFAASLASVVPPNELRVCRAADGNVLEAINLTLNVLEKHYMDRDVQRPEVHSIDQPASGVFAVDARLARVTKQRMMDNGIGMDMLSLAVRSRCPTWCLHHASSPEEVGGLFFDFEGCRRGCPRYGAHLHAPGHQQHEGYGLRGAALDQPVVCGPRASGRRARLGRGGGASARSRRLAHGASRFAYDGTGGGGVEARCGSGATSEVTSVSSATTSSAGFARSFGGRRARHVATTAPTTSTLHPAEKVI